MPKPGKTMNVLRWIFGIPLGFAVALGLLFVMVTVDTGTVSDGFSFSFAFHVFLAVIICSLPVFLSCLFTPSPKKLAALISVSVIALFTIALFIRRLIVDPPFYSAEEIASVLGSYMIVIAGSSTGFAASYAVFKNKGWNRKLTAPEMPEDY